MGARDRELSGIGQGHALSSAFEQRHVLRLDQRGHEAQVVANRVTRSELAQSCRARRKHFALPGQADARNRSLREGLDLAGLKYALQVRF
jgi:hypothetical protein